MLCLGEGVEEDDDDGDDREDRRDATGCQTDAVEGLGTLGLGLRDVAEGSDDGQTDGAAGALAALADEGEDRVGATLGTDVGLPLAVVDGVSLHREHHRVGATGAGTEDEPGGDGQRQAAAGHEVDHRVGQHGDAGQRHISLALAEGHGEAGEQRAARMVPTACASAR